MSAASPDPEAPKVELHWAAADRLELEKRFDHWRRHDLVARLWARDASLWTGSGEEQWLGWLEPGEGWPAAGLDRIEDFAAAGSIDTVLLLGMGGSSLGAEVAVGLAPPDATAVSRHLVVLDSTDPRQVARVGSDIDPDRTLVLVASKSGSTLETALLGEWFWERFVLRLGPLEAPSHFVAVTDPGSRLEALARDRGYLAVVAGEPTIGGRFSVLSPFGLTPLALCGRDVDAVLRSAASQAERNRSASEMRRAPALALGVSMGFAAASLGRDKLVLWLPEERRAMGAWLEQLIAESTGKRGRGIVPLMAPAESDLVAREDKLLVVCGAGAEAAVVVDQAPAAELPVVHWNAAPDLGAELYAWQLATAVAGAELGLNPFDQPDVEAAKGAARRIMAAPAGGASTVPFADAVLSGADATSEPAPVAAAIAGVEEWLGGIEDLGYVAILAFLDRSPILESEIEELRRAIVRRSGAPALAGFGPRYLHSTGQLFKGGPTTGSFLVLTAPIADRVPIPGQRYGFASVERAQALADIEVLRERGRRVLHLAIEGDPQTAVRCLRAAIEP